MRTTIYKLATSVIIKSIPRLVVDKIKNSFRHRQQKELFWALANPAFNLSVKDLALSQKALVAGNAAGSVSSATWFVPPASHIAFGGMQTIFRIIDHLVTKGITSRVVVCHELGFDLSKMRKQIIIYFPKLRNIEIRNFDLRTDAAAQLPPSDIAVCTYWTTAFVALRFNQTSRKFYLIQDFEPNFYEGGAFYALAESTYRFGFDGIFNTPGLSNFIKNRYDMKGIDFIPAVDHRYKTARPESPPGKIRIFFYARPDKPRNAFPLGVAVMRHLLERHGDTIEIVTAGGDWDPSAHGIDRVKSLGLLPGIDAVAALYRTCHIGFVFMLSKHPSYQPIEFMASGMATVTNINEDNLWLLKHGENCLLAQPSPASMADAIDELIRNSALKERIVQNGYKSISFDWESPLDAVSNFISGSKT